MSAQPDPNLSAAPAGRSEDSGSQAFAEALRSSFGLIKILMVLLLLAFIASGIFTVHPQQQAVILRFGRPVGVGEQALLKPGLHWSLPAPIDERIFIAITELQRVESTTGWYAVTPEQEASGMLPPPANMLRPGVDGYVLTADQNIVHTRATLYYRVTDPIQFLFDYVNATNVIQNALDEALINTAARFKVDDILYVDTAGFQDAVRKRANDLIQAQNIGVTLDRCAAQSKAPRWLASAFAQVLTADINRNTARNEAERYENQTMSRARADSVSMTNAAEASKVRMIKDAKADNDRFKSVLPKYQANPDLFVLQSLTEVMSRILTNADVELLPLQNGGQRQLRLLLNRELPPRKSATGQ